jgi:uncharacterized membrane protein
MHPSSLKLSVFLLATVGLCVSVLAGTANGSPALVSADSAHYAKTMPARSRSVPGQTLVKNSGETSPRTAEPLLWLEQEVKGKDISGQEDNLFGSSVALSGNTAIIGAMGTGENSGLAYVFRKSGGTWEKGATLYSTEGRGDYFGSSIAISGDTVIVGAMGLDEGQQGAAYVFKNSGGTWTAAPKLTGSTENFGNSVAIDGGSSPACVGSLSCGA